MQVLREVRCPSCNRLQFKALLTGDSMVETLCRCKTVVLAHGPDTFAASAMAASPSATFGGVSYAGFGVAVR